MSSKIQITPAEVAAELLWRTVDREREALRSSALGVALVLATQWNTNSPGLLWLFVVCRGLTMAHNMLVVSRIRAIGARAALEAQLDGRMALGLAAAGASWGLLAWLIHPVSQWTINDLLLVVIILLVPTLMLITMAHLWRGGLGFNAGLWSFALGRVLSSPHPEAVPLTFGALVMLSVLLLYGRQLHLQLRAAVTADLRNRALADELAEVNQQLSIALRAAEDLATRDPLTNVLNRRALLAIAASEFSAMSRHGYAACLVLVDLDHFKRVNDEHGHAAGDEALRLSSQALQRELRGADSMARWGGEEFLILLPMTTLADGAIVAERLRMALSQARSPHWPPALNLTGSFGLAVWSPRMSIEEAVASADAAMYQAKIGGRNRVCSLQGGVSP